MNWLQLYLPLSVGQGLRIIKARAGVRMIIKEEVGSINEGAGLLLTRTGSREHIYIYDYFYEVPKFVTSLTRGRDATLRRGDNLFPRKQSRDRRYFNNEATNCCLV